LELLDDTVYDSETRDSKGVAELYLQDTADEWEARLLGMLSLRHGTCKLNQECVREFGQMSLSDDLPIGDIASGNRKELHLYKPDAKLAAFLASFLARASPDIVRIFMCDKEGNPMSLHKSSSVDAPPIILVPGGGLTAHISTDERGTKILDFSGKGLSVYSLRFLVEAARSDEDMVEATIAGVGKDLSQEDHAQNRFKCKSVFSEMRLQSNRFGEQNSVTSIGIICDVIAISASNLEILNLSSNKISSAGGGILAQQRTRRFQSQARQRQWLRPGAGSG
jgi:hypothetical protein